MRKLSSFWEGQRIIGCGAAGVFVDTEKSFPQWLNTARKSSGGSPRIYAGGGGLQSAGNEARNYVGFSPGVFPALKRKIKIERIPAALKRCFPRMNAGAPTREILRAKEALRMTIRHSRSNLRAFAVAGFLLLLLSSLAAAQQTWQQVPIPPLPKFTPQEPTRVQLPNGMV